MARTVWATCVMAMAIAGCGGTDPHGHDAGDATLSGDGLPADHPSDSEDGPVIGGDGGDGGMNAPCFVPAECLPGLVCCLSFVASSGTVSCQPSVTCPGDGDTTFIACATSADCLPARPTCTFLTTTNRGDFNVCE